MNAKQKLDMAMERLEQASQTVVERAERLLEQNSHDGRKWARIYLLAAAREYGNALRHLARVS